MAKYIVGENGKPFVVGEIVYYKVPASKTVLKPDMTPRFPDGFAEVTCKVTKIDENNDDMRYTLVAQRRTLSYGKGYKFVTSGQAVDGYGPNVQYLITRKKTIGNGRKRASRKPMTSKERKLAAQALIHAGGRDNVRAAMELLK